LAALEEGLPAGTTYQAIVHRDNTRGLALWHGHGFVTVARSTRAAHFAAHRGLAFEDTPEEAAFILERTLP
jgi:hypothetical protein